jgi:ferritin-like metal-binding protein YciE
LGHRISAAGVSTDSSKLAPILKWKQPTNVKELRSFLGMTGYYRKFIRGYGVISKTLTELLKKGMPYVWNADREAAFQALKQALVTAPVLALPDFAKTFVVEMDACGKGVGAALLQDNHPLAFISKALGPRHLGLSTYEKECLAILMEIEKWRPYLQDSEFIIHTDQRSLMHLDDKRLSTPWQHKALTKLLGLSYKILYKKGVVNKVADALSRHIHEDTEELLEISVCKPVWFEEVVMGYQQDRVAQQKLEQLAVTSPQGNYTLQKGLIRHKGRVWIGCNLELQKKILHALHTSAIGGHSGFHATYNRVKQLFSWPGLKEQVKQFVASCLVCQQAKTERVAYPGLLEPLKVPDGFWQVVTMDFINGLPASSGFDCIMVIVDKLSRYAHFIPLKHPFSAFSVAMAYVKEIYRLHGLPQAIVSDRDPVFTSSLWQELFRLTQTELRMSSARHPETDGQTERVNQCLEGFLRCFVSSWQKKWVQWIPLAEFWYNTTVHSSLGKTPFEAIYGHKPRHFGIDIVESCAVPNLQQWLRDREEMTNLLQQHLQRQQQRMKNQADKKRTERHFQEGEWVFLKLHLYVQTSVAKQGSRKMAFRFYGPFKILQKVGKVAYKLALPTTSQIHPVIHVS